MEKRSVSLILPMFNEKEYLEKTVSTVISVLEPSFPDFEVIVVDDASNDGSGMVAERLAAGDSRIRVIHHKKNRKLGGVLKTGFSAASKEIVVYTDMDMPFDLSQLSAVIPLVFDSDIVIGCRIGKRESFLRVVYSWAYNKLINVIFKTRVKDVNFALKIFKRKILNEIKLKSEGSFINAEFLAKARKLGYSIKEVEIDYTPRTYGISRLSTPPVICKVLYEIVKFYPEIIRFSKKKAIYGRLRDFYKNAGRKAKIYNFLRFKTCPFDKIEKFIPKTGSILDLGCGTGLLLNTLRLEQDKRALFGFDRDARKIGIAAISLNESRDIVFKKADISGSSLDLPKASAIILTDVMYCLDHEKKIGLLEKCFTALDAGGTLLIKDIDRSFNIKFFWAFLQEFLAVKIFGLTSADGIYFENKKQYLSLLKKSGFIANQYFDLSKGYFYPHILYAGKKP
ncbi:MAG: glycosyltransferase [Candidatus Omnitrophota bacterium]